MAAHLTTTQPYVTYMIHVNVPCSLKCTKPFAIESQMYEILLENLPFNNPAFHSLTTWTLNEDYLVKVIAGSSAESDIRHMTCLHKRGYTFRVSVTKTDIVNKHLNRMGVFKTTVLGSETRSIIENILRYNPDIAICTRMTKYNYETKRRVPLNTYKFQMRQNKPLPQAIHLDPTTTTVSVMPYKELPVRCAICLSYTHSTKIQCPMRMEDYNNCGICGRRQPLNLARSKAKQKRVIAAHTCEMPYACPNCPYPANNHSPSDTRRCPARKSLSVVHANLRDPTPEQQESEPDTPTLNNQAPLSMLAYTLHLSETIEQVIYTPPEDSHDTTEYLSDISDTESIRTSSSYKATNYSGYSDQEDGPSVCKYTHTHTYTFH